MTGLAEMGGGDHRYRAPDYDTLVDSPILIGNPSRLRVHRRRQEALPGERGRGRRVRRRTRGEGSRDDRPRTAPHLGHASLRQVSLPQHAHRRRAGRRPRAQELDRPHDEPLDDADATRLPCLARAGQPRVLSRLERQAPAAGGARAFRLRERGSHPQPLDRRRRHGLLRRSCWCTAPACRRATSISRTLSSHIEELQTTPGRLVQSAELASFDAWIKYYRPDENSRTRPSAITQRGRARVPARREDSQRHERERSSLDDVMRAAYQRYCRRARLHARGVSGGGGAGCGREPRVVLGSGGRGHGASSTTSEALETFGLRFRPRSPARRAPGSA